MSIVDATGKHMEVIVDDTQLSLAIGKKGQNVRLAAKLLGWKIDIKSEEEKRQEVESQMAALSMGAPVSALIDQGLPEDIVDKLNEGGIGTVEKLGSMTPEELEQIPGIGPTMVERIQDAVLAYYSQFEPQVDPVEAEEPVEAALEETATEPEVESVAPLESEAVEAASGTVETEEAPVDPVLETEPGEPVAAEQSLDAGREEEKPGEQEKGKPRKNSEA